MLFVLLLACAPNDPEPSRTVDVPTGTPTETMPVFEGRVPTNLLMVSIDTLRKDHLSRYDPYGRDLTPFLDGLIRTGVVMDDHLTCSNWTFPGVSCTLLGRNHTDVGFVPQLEPANMRIPWPAGQPFLADWMKEAGFYTVLSSANGYLSAEYGPGAGYDQSFARAFDPAENIYQTGLNFLEQGIDSGAADKWFLHLHFLEPHAPYLWHDGYTPNTSDLDPVGVDLEVKQQHYSATSDWPRMSRAEQENLKAHLTRRYQGEVEYLDAFLEGMFADLGTRGLLEDTLVVVWSDHGETFWEHGHQSHAWTLHRPENDGVLFFWAPNIVPAQWSGPTHQTDLVPTLLGLYGIEPPDGITGIPIGIAPNDRPRFASTVARAGVQQSVVVGDTKLIYDWSGAAEVYDLESDPDEQRGTWSPADPQHMYLWSLLAPEVSRLEPLVTGFGAMPPDGAGL